MRDVQIYRSVLDSDGEQALRTMAQEWIRMTEAGHHRLGRIYDDLWPLNLAGVEGVVLPLMFERIVDRYAKDLYPNGYSYSNALILCTTRYPYCGQWHADAPPYEDDTIALLCVDGYDEMEYAGGYRANLNAGDLCLLPAAMPHRGRCTTNRITWHVRVGPKGNTFPNPYCGCQLPPMSVKRFLRRTICTACYYLLGNSTPWRKS